MNLFEKKTYKCVENGFRFGDVVIVDMPDEVANTLKGYTRKLVGRRPYVIINPNEYLKKNPFFIQALPITSTESVAPGSMLDRIQVSAEFINSFGDKNRVIANQIETIEVVHIKKYLYRLPDNLMEDILSFLKMQLGFQNQSSYGCVESDDYEPIYLGSNTDNNDIPEKEPIMDYDDTNDEPTYSNTVKMSDKPKRKTIIWTPKSGRMFLDDYMNMSCEEIALKWGIENNARNIYNRARYVTRKIIKTDFNLINKQRKLKFGKLT